MCDIHTHAGIHVEGGRVKQVWDDDLKRHVDVPEYKMVITLDIPD